MLIIVKVKRSKPFDLESGVRVTCDMGYLWANFSLSRPLYSRLRPDVRDRQTEVRRRHRLISRIGGHNNNNQIYIAPYDRNFRGVGASTIRTFGV